GDISETEVQINPIQENENLSYPNLKFEKGESPIAQGEWTIRLEVGLTILLILCHQNIFTL
ncbi:MAG: hypothetical protein IKI26_08780, partial [Prevotella sp.]|nr:hypothetical protein [Prevotella sp.]